MSFSGKVVLITGAAGGIGIAAAKKFANEGAKLALVDLKKENLTKVAAEVTSDHILLLEGNVAVEEDVKSFVEATKEHYGRIDVFINNAGINGKFANLVDQTAENFDAVINVNLKGVFYGLKYVLKVMNEQKSGAIVNTASNGGLLGAPGMGLYVASKHGVIGLTKTAALEGAPYNVRVNAVAPSGVDTQMMRSIETNAMPGNEDNAKEQFEASVPMKRYATAEEIANLMAFLASEDASFISGSYYRIDGGQGATSA
ncbi:SDR family NAD(P)-dependent oxidoreductase [Niallia taxi]|uniref:SDR family NAD(P)-dependent oxidoreductase n=1 Tax=Niallia taxi TaxID=2499688 RepID=UPI00119CBC43|nr:SDR family NAD(P)-dependent oxidoreductase [Niallia taxi]MCM3213460.1 SDR family oxidoreductase [Niallia taxi]MCT2345552.1 SDR family oxidoreductase [Niallia taxi]MDE5054159.1 SDR family NAD(P)-dependent oxidoreductase [Niallia taxi]MED3961197.1 SDR family NAD(P)-dependent oxidoreductase [Niallia taxi]MED4036142.1 SDR family NAD(P)-dependent oxidoreductase [Niallia taxi]